MVYELGFRCNAVFLKGRKKLEQMVLKKFTTFILWLLNVNLCYLA